MGCREEDNVADDCEGGGGDDKGCAFVGLFCEDCEYDCKYSCECIGRGGEQLSGGGFVAECGDDGGEEEGEGVEG